MTMEKNKLWVSQANAEAIETAENHPHGYACSDHCLFIGPEAPKGAVEVNDDLIGYLTQEDWAWIYGESNKIRREQEEHYHKELMEAQEQFFARFEADLKSAIAEGENGEPKQETDQTDAGSAEN
jgi:hypothetical protein